MVQKINPLEWQKESYEKWVKNNYCGVDVVSTGAGKTISALHKMLSLRKRTLIVVPTEVLMLQWFEEIKKFVDVDLDKVGFYYGKKKEIKPITIAIINSVAKSDFKFDEYFNFLIIDEIHNINENRFENILENSKFKYKLGLTATIKRQDDFHHTIINYMGGVNHEVSEKEAIDKNYINRFTFVSVPIELEDIEDIDFVNKSEEKLKKYLDNAKEASGESNFNPFCQNINSYNNTVKIYIMHYKREFAKLKKFLFSHYSKNKKTIELIEKNLDKKIIVFNEFNDNAKLLKDILETKGYNPLIINSNNKKSIKNILEKFSQKEYNILISTKILDEGYNLPDIDMGIIVAGVSTQKQIKQRVGRIIRKKEKESFIYQLYIAGTRDEKYAEKRKSYIDYATNYIILR